ncbi:hypothetical protein FNB79_15190 [Formosa sediminum]|uniref:Endonuclease/exonuclease/phosphatase family protein n=1 Tax=Formosa sediminum TaxID=2594004 RepID=A0A516GUR2_9FLAO|nr:hypothetical protein [Formosa sediminum]QDO95261.1 hypothetical protein FNB79_15190 [Formosa sediminum]
MKIASYNIENLFHRDRNLSKAQLKYSHIKWINELDSLISQTRKSNAEIRRIRELAFLLGFENITHRPYAILQKKASNLYFKGYDLEEKTKVTLINNYEGWIALQTKPIPLPAIYHKAKVISEINPEILILQNVEDRASLEEFNNTILPTFDCNPYTQIHVIQNSDKNGMEIGLLLREGYELCNIKTHYLKPITEFKIMSPRQNIIRVIAVHFKSNIQNKDVVDECRAHFTTYLANRFKTILKNDETNIIITGTFGAPSYCYSNAPLMQDTKIKDITKHLSFEVILDEGEDQNYHRIGAYRKGVNIKQQDYMLLSPSLFNKLKDSGLNRKGVWPENRPKWRHYSTLKNKIQEASSHPLVWGNVELL